MKKTLFSIITLLSVSLSAQTLTQANNAPAANESFSRYQCDSTGVTLGASGTNKLWDFSALATHTTIVTDYAVRSNTNTTYNPADVTVSVAQNGDKSYYKSSATDLKYYGGNFLAGNFSVALTYSNPAVMAIYSMTYNTANSNTITGSMTVNSSFTGTFTGTAGLFADGTGTLVLPSKTFTDVIKVTTSQVINANISNNTVDVIQLTVNYYSVSNPKAAILTIATSTMVSLVGGTNTQTIVTVLKDYTSVGINETEKETIAVTMFPNPANQVANFSTTHNNAFKVTAYDVTGKLVATTVFENNLAKLNVQHLTPGIYLYTVTDKNNQALKTGKFTIEK